MTASPEGITTTEPVERFRPTSGRVLGYAGLVAVVGLVVYLAVAVHTLNGLRLALGLIFFGVLIWTTQLRPRAAAYPDVLRLKNVFRDATVPLAMIDDVTVRRTLNVWAGHERFVCVGIGQSLRSMVKAKSRGPSALLGFDRLEAYTQQSTPPRPDQTAMSYSSFVEVRIEALAADAKRLGKGTDLRPRRTWAWPEIAALVVTGLAFVVSLVV